MALFVRQNEERSKLQERLAAELQERAKQRSNGDAGAFDAEKDSAYLKDTKNTTSLAWVWVTIVIFVIGLIVWLFASALNS